MNIFSKYILIQIIDVFLTTADCADYCINEVEEEYIDVLEEEEKESYLFSISNEGTSTGKL